MKHRHIGPILVLLIFAVGCQSLKTSPADRWYESASLVAGVNDTVADLHDVGVLTTEDVAGDLKPWLDTMNASLDRAHGRLPDGGDSFEAMMDTLHAARDAVQAYVLKKQGGE